MRKPPFDAESYLRVLNDLNVGVYITDLERRIVLANRESERITDRPAETVVNTHCCNIFVCQGRSGNLMCDTDLCPLSRATVSGACGSHYELQAVSSRSGEAIPVSVSTAPMFDGERRIIGGIHVFRKAAEQVRELTLAQRVQSRLLEASIPADAPLEFQVAHYPHDLVAGDYYDIRRLGPNRYGVLVADVTGHGMAAALYTLLLKSLVEAASESAARPREFLQVLNRQVDRFTLPESFATAVYAVVDTATWELTCSIAGHPPPLRCRPSSPNLEPLPGRGFPLGMFEDGEYDQSTVEIDRGETLLFFTDGLFDLFRESDSGSSRAQLEAIVCEELRSKSEHDLERLYRRVLDASGCIRNPDDVVLLSLHRPFEPRESAVPAG